MPVLQAVQHTWTYKPLVQDVLGMSLNRVTLDAEPSTSQQILQQSAASKKTYEVRSSCTLMMHLCCVWLTEQGQTFVSCAACTTQASHYYESPLSA